MKRPGLKYLNNICDHPLLSDKYWIPDSMDASGERDNYYLDHLNKMNFRIGSLTRINKKDFKINREDFYKL